MLSDPPFDTATGQEPAEWTAEPSVHLAGSLGEFTPLDVVEAIEDDAPARRIG